MSEVLQFPARGDQIMAIPKINFAQPAKKIAVRNVTHFYKEQWKQAEPQGKTVYNITTGNHDPRLSTLELVAKRAKIPVWYLVADIPEQIINDPRLDTLVRLFSEADEPARAYILKAAELSAK